MVRMKMKQRMASGLELLEVATSGATAARPDLEVEFGHEPELRFALLPVLEPVLESKRVILAVLLTPIPAPGFHA